MLTPRILDPLYDGLARGAPDRVRRCLAPQVRHRVFGTDSRAPFCGEFEGRDAVFQQMQMVDRNFQTVNHAVWDKAVDGTSAALRVSSQLQHRFAPMKLLCEAIHFLTGDEHGISEFDIYVYRTERRSTLSAVPFGLPGHLNPLSTWVGVPSGPLPVPS